MTKETPLTKIPENSTEVKCKINYTYCIFNLSTCEAGELKGKVSQSAYINLMNFFVCFGFVVLLWFYFFNSYFMCPKDLLCHLKEIPQITGTCSIIQY